MRSESEIMGKLAIFEISFNNASQDVYYGGQTVAGTVTVGLAAPMKMRGIYLTVSGQANTNFVVTTGMGKNRRRQTVRGYESYMNNKFPVFGRDLSGIGDEVTELPAGQHVFPFQCHLPPDLPSSFEGRYGHVKYTVFGNIYKPWKFDYTTIRMFTVICPLDLNMDPSSGQPAQNQELRTPSFLCCGSDPISGKLSVPKKGYVPGEFITYTADASNGTNKQTTQTLIQLFMVTTYHAMGHSTTWADIVLNIQKPPLGPRQSASWPNESVQVPAVPPSYLMHCNLIHIKYYLQVGVDPGGFSPELRVPVDIIIGTIPLRESCPQYWAQPRSANADDGIIPPALPPPSYSECVGGQTEPGADSGDVNKCLESDHEKEERADGRNQYTMGQKNFKPVYPVYKY